MELGILEKDFLKEVATIGGGSAATSLSKILKHTIRIEVPDIYVLDYSNLFTKLGNPDEKSISILANLKEPTKGIMLFILNVESANFIMENIGLKKINDSDTVLEPLGESALTEIGNILFSTYLGSLSRMTKKMITSDAPFCIFDMLGAILNYPINVMPEVVDKIVFMDVDFKIDHKKIEASLLFISNYNQLKEYMKPFGV